MKLTLSIQDLEIVEEALADRVGLLEKQRRRWKNDGAAVSMLGKEVEAAKALRVRVEAALQHLQETVVVDAEVGP